MRAETIWLGIGFLGQGMFFMRFLVQWIASEIQKRSIIPLAFWYFSFFGGLTLLAYAIYRRDPVFIIGQSTGSIIYIRNLQLVYKERRTSANTNSSEG
jgi:lipid-A-disaccharide synthase-like uncharacterized protein